MRATASGGSLKDNLERRALLRVREHESPLVVLFDDAFGERQSDAPAALLRGKPGIEDPRAQVAWNPRTVARDRDEDATVRAVPRGHANLATTTGECVDGIFCEHFDRPLEQHRVASD